MKNILIGIMCLFTLSCSYKPDFVGKKVYENVTKIVHNNKIENFELKGKVNLKNGEINVYHINKLKIDSNIPKVVLDVDFNNGISDGLIIYQKVDGNFIVDFNSITEKVKTINKKIPFLIVPKNSNITVNLAKNIVIDNTQFIIEKIENDIAKSYILTPIFLDEDTNYIKLNQKIKYHTNVAKYNEKYLVQYNLINGTEKGKIVYNYGELDKNNGALIEGTHTKGSDVIIENENEYHMTKVDDKGEWKILTTSKAGEGIIYGVDGKGQKTKVETVKWGEGE